MQKRPKTVRAEGVGAEYHHCVTPSSTPKIQRTHTCTHFLPSSNRWEDVSSELPLLSSITLTPEDSWEADIPSSQLSEENKRVCGTPPTHTCMCSHTHTHTDTNSPQKNCQCNCGLIIFQRPEPASQQRYEC